MLLLQTEPAVPSMVAFLLVIGVWALSDWSIRLRYRTTADAAQDRGSKRVIGVTIIIGILAAVLASVLPRRWDFPATRARSGAASH